MSPTIFLPLRARWRSRATPGRWLSPRRWRRPRGGGRRRCWSSRGCRRRRRPGLRAVSPAVVQKAAVIPAPHDHFTARPDCRLIPSAGWDVGDAGGCPTVCAGIVSPAAVQHSRSPPQSVKVSAPHDHFTAGPDGRVVEPSGIGCVGAAGGCPTICGGIVSAAGAANSSDWLPPQTIISLPVQTAV